MFANGHGQTQKHGQLSLKFFARCRGQACEVAPSPVFARARFARRHSRAATQYLSAQLGAFEHARADENMTMRSRHAAASNQQKPFLQDAFEQLDEVLRRTNGNPDLGPEAVRAARTQIQRWLAVFAREHLTDICAKLMSTALDYQPAEPETPNPKSIRLPQKADRESEGTESAKRDDSVGFFLLETLRRVLLAAAERGSLTMLPARDGALLPFCYDHLSLTRPAAIRHVAGLCVGILSRSQLTAACELFAVGLAHLSGDKQQREYVAYQRAASHLHTP